MHRLVNKTPEGKFTDHVNGNRLDNRKSNLRTCYRSGNALNAQKAKGQTGLVGVYPSGSASWRARVKINGIMKHLGTFSSPRAASRARETFVKNYIGAGN